MTDKPSEPSDPAVSEAAARASGESDLRSAMVSGLRAADGLLFCTDFDGTLAEIETDPDASAITPTNRVALETLRDHPAVRVAVISGRELADLRDRVGVAGVAYAGNHGLELFRDGETTVHPVAKKREHELERIIDLIEDELADTDCFVENKTVSATVHYRNAPEHEGRVDEAVETAVEEVSPDGFERSTGKEIVELTPAVDWNKGRVVSLLADEHESYLGVYIGDDTTDEAAFEVLSTDGIGIHVGLDDETAAAYRLADPEAVTGLLDWLTADALDELDTGASTA